MIDREGLRRFAANLLELLEENAWLRKENEELKAQQLETIGVALEGALGPSLAPSVECAMCAGPLQKSSDRLCADCDLKYTGAKR